MKNLYKKAVHLRFATHCIENSDSFNNNNFNVSQTFNKGYTLEIYA